MSPPRQPVASPGTRCSRSCWPRRSAPPALVPALAVMRDGMALGEIIDTRHLLLTYGVSKMEEQLAIVGATWATGNRDGQLRSRRPVEHPL